MSAGAGPSTQGASDVVTPESVMSNYSFNDGLELVNKWASFNKTVAKNGVLVWIACIGLVWEFGSRDDFFPAVVTLGFPLDSKTGQYSKSFFVDKDHTKFFHADGRENEALHCLIFKPTNKTTNKENDKDNKLKHTMDRDMCAFVNYLDGMPDARVRSHRFIVAAHKERQSKDGWTVQLGEKTVDEASFPKAKAAAWLDIIWSLENRKELAKAAPGTPVQLKHAYEPALPAGHVINTAHPEEVAGLQALYAFSGLMDNLFRVAR